MEGGHEKWARHTLGHAFIKELAGLDDDLVVEWERKRRDQWSTLGFERD